MLIISVRTDTSERTNFPLARRLETSARATPMNIDGDAAQMTVADCLFLTAQQQLMSESSSYTQEVLADLDPEEAVSYNPTLDFWLGPAGQCFAASHYHLTLRVLLALPAPLVPLSSPASSAFALEALGRCACWPVAGLLALELEAAAAAGG